MERWWWWTAVRRLVLVLMLVLSTSESSTTSSSTTEEPPSMTSTPGDVTSVAGSTESTLASSTPAGTTTSQVMDTSQPAFSTEFDNSTTLPGEMTSSPTEHLGNDSMTSEPTNTSSSHSELSTDSDNSTTQSGDTTVMATTEVTTAPDIDPCDSYSVEFTGITGDRYVAYNISLTMPLAEDFCIAEGGYLLSFTETTLQEMEDADFLCPNSSYWIGLYNCEGWSWLDHTGGTHLPWADSQHAEKNCVKMDNYQLFDKGCSNEMPFICKFRSDGKLFEEPCQTPRQRDTCDCYWTDYNKTGTWKESNDQCELQGGSLAVIGNEKVKNFIYKYLFNNAVNESWIGLSDAHTEGVFRWITTHAAPYVFWNDTNPSGEPDKDCVYIRDGDGTWLDARCDEQRPYVCRSQIDTCDSGVSGCLGTRDTFVSYDQCLPMDSPTMSSGDVASLVECESSCSSTMYFNCRYILYNDTSCLLYEVAPNPASSPTCPDTAVTEMKTFTERAYEDWCFHYHTPNKTWADAKSKCSDDHRGTLVTIKNINESAYLDVKREGEDIWIGLSDLAAEGVYRYTDGNYPEWAPWQGSDPDDDVNKDCVLWKTDDAFLEEDCNLRKPFMCENTVVNRCDYLTETIADATKDVWQIGDHLTNVTYECVRGHLFPLNLTLDWVSCDCQDTSESLKNKTDALGLCIPLDCGTPEFVYNATIIDVATISTTYLSVITYSSDAGYWFGNNVFTKTSTCEDVERKIGRWTDVPTTTVIDCGTPDVGNHITYASGATTLYDDQITLNCEYGYWVSHNVYAANITCGMLNLTPRKAGWTSDPPCEEVDCGIPPSVDNAALVTPYTTTYRSIVTYRCDNGFHFDNTSVENTTVCQGDEEWTVVTPCVAMFCQEPTQIQNASLSYNTTSINSIANYTCDETLQFPNGDTQHLSVCTTDPVRPWLATWLDEPGGCSEPPTTVQYTTADALTTPVSTLGVDTTTVSETTLEGEFTTGMGVTSGVSVESTVAVVVVSDGVTDSTSIERATSTSDVVMVSTVASTVVDTSEFPASTSGVGGVATTSTLHAVEFSTSEQMTEFSTTDDGVVHSTKGSVTSVDGVTSEGSVTTTEADLLLESTSMDDLATAMPESASTWDPYDWNIHIATLQCPSLPNVAKATLTSTERGAYAQGIYECERNHVYSEGGIQRSTQCMLNSMWSVEVKECTPILCPEAPSVTDATYVNTDRRVNAVVTYTCFDDKLFPNGMPTYQIKCQKNGVSEIGQWTPTPASCEARCSPLRIFQNASVASSYNSEVSGMVTVQCHQGHRFSNGQKSLDLTCESNLQWADPGDCIIDVCPALHTPINGSLSTDTAVFGTIVDVTCDYGYHFPEYNQSITAECLEDTVWDVTTIPDCDLILCEEPAVIPYATRDGSSKLYLSTYTYVCQGNKRFEDGYTEKVITCQENEEWSETAFTCGDNRCTPVPTVHNSVPSTNLALMGTTVVYQCIPGHLFADKMTEYNIYCDGQNWNYTNTMCTALDCPSLEDNPYIIASSDDVMFGTSVNLTCEAGYTLGQEYITSTCQSTGEWSSQNVSCEPIQCEDPPDVWNSVLDTNISGSTYYYKSWLRFSCLDGFWFERDVFNQIIFCSKYGLWEPAILSCQELRCPALPEWSGTVVNTTVRSYRTPVNVSCAEGYRFSDREMYIEATCSSWGLWDPYPPDCILAEPEKPYEPEPTESENSKAIGTFAIIIFAVTLCVILISDTITIMHGFEAFFMNLSDGYQRLKDFLCKR